jgi:hypothetical protein
MVSPLYSTAMLLQPVAMKKGSLYPPAWRGAHSRHADDRRRAAVRLHHKSK